MGNCIICNCKTADSCPLCECDCCSSCVTEELCLECTNTNCDGPKGTQSCCELCIENAECADLPPCEVASDDPDECEHPNEQFDAHHGMWHCPDCHTSWQGDEDFDSGAGQWG